jgi:hypothetical protein
VLLNFFCYCPALLKPTTIDQSSGYGLACLRLRPFLYFTALTLPVCALLILWLDKPLALFTHRHAGGLVPFFEAITNGADAVNEWLFSMKLGGWPLVFVAPLIAYVVGRWVLRRPGATLFLVLLLTRIASEGAATVLKVTVAPTAARAPLDRRLRGSGAGRGRTPE